MADGIWASALYGAIGGGLGALLGVFAGRFFGGGSTGRFMVVALAVIGASLGGRVAGPMLDPYIGEYIGNSEEQRLARAETEIDETIAKLRDDVLIAAMMTREPALEGEVRIAMQRILAEPKKRDDARREMFNYSYQLIVSRITDYMTRATNEDLLVFGDVMVGVLDHLTETDAFFCHDYLYNGQALANKPDDYVSSKIGEARFSILQNRTATLVTNAFDAVPDYDADNAQLIIGAAGQFLYQRMGDASIDTITTGRAPKDEAEAKAACSGTSALYRFLLESDLPADALRHLMVMSKG